MAAEEKSRQDDSRILRFHKSERLMHWALAIPFLICWTSALVLIVVYNPQPDRPYRELLSWIHRISGIGFITLPLAAVFVYRRDIRIHFHNIAQAWLWTFSDLKWLALIGLATVFPKVKLPEQGKFNAGEKLNFMVVMCTYPLYILTGAFMWFTNAAALAWLLHVGMALVATPFLIGHIFMAVINPSTRKGLQGMFSGFVDRQWAKHHYGKWYEEHYGTGLEPVGITVEDAPSIVNPAIDQPGVQEPARRVTEPVVQQLSAGSSPLPSLLPDSPADTRPEPSPELMSNHLPENPSESISRPSPNPLPSLLPDNHPKSQPDPLPDNPSSPLANPLPNPAPARAQFNCFRCAYEIHVDGMWLARKLYEGANCFCPHCGAALPPSYVGEKSGLMKKSGDPRNLQ